MLHLKIFVLEILPVDGLTTSPIRVLKISALNHEAFYYSMKNGALLEGEHPVYNTGYKAGQSTGMGSQTGASVDGTLLKPAYNGRL